MTSRCALLAPEQMVAARVKTSGPTGVEMEALTAASAACLTIYDMLKAAKKGMVIEAVRLTSKTGGKSGDWASASTGVDRAEAHA